MKNFKSYASATTIPSLPGSRPPTFYLLTFGRPPTKPPIGTTVYIYTVIFYFTNFRKYTTHSQTKDTNKVTKAGTIYPRPGTPGVMNNPQAK